MTFTTLTWSKRGPTSIIRLTCRPRCYSRKDTGKYYPNLEAMTLRMWVVAYTWLKMRQGSLINWAERSNKFLPNLTSCTNKAKKVIPVDNIHRGPKLAQNLRRSTYKICSIKSPIFPKSIYQLQSHKSTNTTKSFPSFLPIRKNKISSESENSKSCMARDKNKNSCKWRKRRSNLKDKGKMRNKRIRKWFSSIQIMKNYLLSTNKS